MSNSNNLSPDAVWFVTGCSSGLGAALATHISQAGYHLAATARDPSALSHLPDDSPRILKLKLDVTSPADISAAVAAAVQRFGRIDVVVNNAGYGLAGDFEATSDADARLLVETNLWGPVNVTREALRVFREVNPRGSGGTVVQVSSMGGYVGLPGNAFYHVSKFGLEGFTEGVAKEMHPEWNIHFMIAEPGGIKTGFSGPSLVLAPRHPAYLDPGCPYNQLAAYIADPKAKETWADAAVVARVIVDTVAHKGERALPLRLPLGSDAWGVIRSDNVAGAKEMDDWRDVSESCSPAAQLESLAFLHK